MLEIRYKTGWSKRLVVRCSRSPRLCGAEGGRDVVEVRKYLVEEVLKIVEVQVATLTLLKFRAELFNAKYDSSG